MSVGVWGWLFVAAVVLAVDLTAGSVGSESMSEVFGRWLVGGRGWLPAGLWLGLSLYLFWGLFVGVTN